MIAMLDIRKYRGALWRKLQEKKAPESELPGFKVDDSPNTFIDIPKVNKISEVSVRYPLIPPFAYANVKWDQNIQQVTYNVEEPILSEEEKKMYKKCCSALVDIIQVGLSSVNQSNEAINYLENQVKKVFKHLGVSLTPDQYTRLMYYIYRDFVGLNQIEPLLRDPMIEDIGCDGSGVPIFVVHRRYGSIRSNVIFHELSELREFVVKLAERTGRYVSYAEPILDGTLPDGSRINASLAGDVTTRGPTFSIRKFTERPFSPIELMDMGTCNAQIMAYFWFLMEAGVSMLIAGGVATGKTTFLNSICMFIPPEAKIVSIEDTRELKLSHEHWIPAVSRLGFGIPLASGEKYGEVTLFDLLKGSFRQNPDYVIVGEVRGKEAYVMFQGMSSIPPWEKITVLNDDHWKKIEIGKLIPKEGFKVVSMDPMSNDIKLTKMRAKIEHKPRNILYKIKTKTGREVAVTPDHSLFTFGNNNIEAIKTDELKIGDKIVIPASLPCGYNDIDYLNLIGLFPDARVFSPIHVQKAVEILGYSKCSKICGVSSISDYYSNFKRSKPSALRIDKFVKLMREASIDLDLDKIIVRFDKKSKNFPAKLKISPEFLKLIGYYISNGSINESFGNSKINFYNKNKDILKNMKNCIKKVTGITPKERSSDRGFGFAVELSFNHKVLFEFFKRFCGKKSNERRIPEFIFGLNKEKIGYFLTALYDGDGWFAFSRKNYYVFGYSTQSRELADDLLYLLLAFNIVAYCKNRTKERKNRGYEILFKKNEAHVEFSKYVKPIKRKLDLDTNKKPVNSKQIFFDEIKSIEKIELTSPVPVFDISASPTQNFVGGFGGIILHNSGHPSIATFHAGSVDTVVKRLTTAPIELSASLVESLDVIVIMIHAREKGKSARRIKEVEEIESIDTTTLRATTKKVVEWDPSADSYVFNPDSIVLRKISHNKGITYEDALKEIEKRKAILQWLQKSGIKDFKEVTDIINEFYKNPKSILDKIGKTDFEASKNKIVEKINGPSTEKPQEQKQENEESKPIEDLKKEEKTDLIKLLGYKIIDSKHRPIDI